MLQKNAIIVDTAFLITKSIYERFAAGQRGLGRGWPTIQPCMSPHCPHPSCSLFPSSLSSWAQLNPCHSIIFTNVVHIFKMGVSMGNQTSSSGNRSSLCPLNSQQTATVAERLLLDVNVKVFTETSESVFVLVVK